MNKDLYHDIEYSSVSSKWDIPCRKNCFWENICRNKHVDCTNCKDYEVSLKTIPWEGKTIILKY